MDHRVKAALVFGAAFLLGAGAIWSKAAALGAPGWLIAMAAGAYALSGLAALQAARGILGLFTAVESADSAFFTVLRATTEPFLRLFRFMTPGFLTQGARCFYVAFVLFAIRIFMFPFGNMPPPWLILYFVMS